MLMTKNVVITPVKKFLDPLMVVYPSWAWTTKSPCNGCIKVAKGNQITPSQLENHKWLKVTLDILIHASLEKQFQGMFV